MLIGYARVSTADQDLALQIDALTKAGCERIFTDKASGAKADRPGLADALEFARGGDALVIWKLDRLGRSFRGLIDLAAGISSRDVDFRSLTDGFDTATPSGRLLFHILASVAEMKRELIKERTIAGLAAVRAKGGTALTRTAYSKWIPVIGREPLPMKADHAAHIRDHRADLLFVGEDLAALVETTERDDDVLIENVAVDPSFQKRGYDRKMVAYAEQLARETGLTTVRLYTNQRFEENLRLYASLVDLPRLNGEAFAQRDAVRSNCAGLM